jgi:hypothetical protein
MPNSVLNRRAIMPIAGHGTVVRDGVSQGLKRSTGVTPRF